MSHGSQGWTQVMPDIKWIQKHFDWSTTNKTYGWVCPTCKQKHYPKGMRGQDLVTKKTCIFCGNTATEPIRTIKKQGWEIVTGNARWVRKYIPDWPGSRPKKHGWVCPGCKEKYHSEPLPNCIKRT